jgi:hypothetical protein
MKLKQRAEVSLGSRNILRSLVLPVKWNRGRIPEKEGPIE